MNHLTKAVIVLSAVVGMNGAFALPSTTTTTTSTKSKPCGQGMHYSPSEGGCVSTGSNAEAARAAE